MRKLLLFLILVALAVFAYGPIMKAIAATRGDKTAVLSCEYSGKTYQLGGQRRAEDSCNICTCGENGWSCTTLSCNSGTSYGTISGKIGLAGGEEPSQRVCAINLADAKEYCQLTVEGDSVYTVPAPAGDYWVYSTQVKSDQSMRAYYSQFQVCGQKPDCKDHTPVTVTLTAGADVKADPMDWGVGGQIDDFSVSPSKWEYGEHEYYAGGSYILNGRKLAGVQVFATPYPPQPNAAASLVGSASETGIDHGLETWSLPIAEGFQATDVYAIGTAENGDYMKSMNLRFVRPRFDDGLGTK